MTGDPNNDLYSCDDVVMMLEKLNHHWSDLGNAFNDAYVNVTIQHHFISQLRSRHHVTVGPMPVHVNEEGVEVAVEYPDPGEDTGAEAEVAISFEGIPLDRLGLTENERKVAIWRIEGVSPQEIADRLGQARNNVNQTMQRVRDKAREWARRECYVLHAGRGGKRHVP